MVIYDDYSGDAATASTGARVAFDPPPKTIRSKGGGLYLLSQTVNFAQQSLDAGNGDVLRVLQVIAETIVLKAWLRVIKAAPATTSVDFGYGTDPNYWGNALVISSVGVPTTVLVGSTTRSGGNIAQGDSETTAITITGAALGDTCIMNIAVDALDLMFYAYAKAANSVETVAQNGSDATADPDGLYEVFVDKAPRGHVPLLFTSADTLDLVATTKIADVDISSGIVEVNALCLDERLA